MIERIRRDPSFTVMVVRGVPVRLQTSAAFLPALGLAAGFASGGVQDAAFLLVLVMGMFACAAGHELGHIVPARLHGAWVTRVRLTGAGAFVQIESPAGIGPQAELAIALGGPLVSALLTVGLGLASWPALAAHGSALMTERSGPALLAALAATNGLLTVFNLLPVFPMDGGRALNAALSLYLRPAQAMHVVSIFGEVTAVALVGVAFVASESLLVRGLSALLAWTIFRVSMRVDRASRNQLQIA